MSRNPFLDVSEFPSAPPSKEVNGLTADIFVSAPRFPFTATPTPEEEHATPRSLRLASRFVELDVYHMFASNAFSKLLQPLTRVTT